MVEFVFDGPVGAVERQQALGRRGRGRQAGDQIDDFGADLAADFARPRQPRDLGKAGPIEMRRGFTAGRDPARLDATVRLACGFRALEIRRRSVVDAGRV